MSNECYKNNNELSLISKFIRHTVFFNNLNTNNLVV